MREHNSAQVKMAATGHWKEIFLALAPSLKHAVEHAGHHVACPVHGGVDGFRLFPNYETTGSGICNTCGAKTDGFSMLMWVNNWTFRQAINAVGDLLLGKEENACGKGTVPEKDPKTYVGRFESLKELPYKHKEGNKLSLCLSLVDEHGELTELWGQRLKFACQTAGVVPGDWISVCRVAREHRTYRDGAASYQKSLWMVRKVDSPAEQAEKDRKRREDEEREAVPKREAIEAVWNASLSLTRKESLAIPALKYLCSRGICPRDGWGSNVLRVHPGLTYFDAQDKLVGIFPCLIAAVKDPQGRLVTLHRTYLSADGRKAKVDVVKKIMPVPNGQTIKGGAIRLGEPTDTLGVAEGIETALSVSRLTHQVCWSVISEGGMRTFEIPFGIKNLVIYADKDRSGVGRKAALELAKKAKARGINVKVKEPPMSIPVGAKGVDFNDYLRQQLRA